MRSFMLALLLVWSSVVEAQRRTGSGISGGFGPSSSFDYVRTHWGPPDSTQLVAAIFFRGISDWGTVWPAERVWVEQAADSAARAAEARGRRAGGTITPRAKAWVEYDDERGVVMVLSREWRVPRRDSALVLLIDRIDHIGGEPTVEPLMIPMPPIAEPPPDSAAIGADPMAFVYAHWEEALRRQPRVRAFLASLR